MSLSLALRRNRLVTMIYMSLRDIYSFISYISKNSYSQHGEDLIIYNGLLKANQGLYVDIGCSHPFRISNTYLFYRKGWNGVAVDPIPHFSWLYRLWRPKDIFVNSGVSSENGTLNYYELLPSVLSSFDLEYVQKLIADNRAQILKEYSVPVTNINTLLQKYIGKRQIDFLNIDVEGMDYSILSSLDFSTYQPKCICIEYNSEADKQKIESLLKFNSYKKFKFTKSNIIAFN